MARIAYLGAPYQARVCLDRIAAQFGGTVAGRPPRFQLETTGPEVGAVTVVSTPTRDQLASADAVVFVVQSRLDELESTTNHWKELPEQLADAGRPANLPVVIQFAERDDPDALPLEKLEEALHVQPFMVSGPLRMPNPFSLRYPARFDTWQPAFEAACRAAITGPFAIPKDAADFAMAMVDKQIAQHMAKVAPSTKNAEQLARRAVKGDEAAKEELLGAAKDDFMDAIADYAKKHPEIVEIMIEQKARKQPAAIATPDLRCDGKACTAMIAQLELVGPRPGVYSPGDDIYLESRRGGDWVLRRPARGAPLVWLSTSQCAACRGWIFATVELEITVTDTATIGTIGHIELVDPTRTLLGRVHVISSLGARLLATHLGGKTKLEEAGTRAQVLETLAQNLT